MPKKGLLLENEMPPFRSRISGRWMRRGAIAAVFAGMLWAEPLAGCMRAYNYGNTQSEVSTLVRGHKGEKDAKDALDTALRYATEDSREAMGRIPQNYAKSRKLAASLGIKDPDAVTYLNLSYGIAAIGEERTAALHRTMGMEFFLRYPKSALMEAYENMSATGASEKPVLLVVFNKNDWNGHFYREGAALVPLAKHYNMLIAEADSEDSLYLRLKSASKDYGKIDTLILAGHGARNSVQLGASDEKGEIDLTDGAELAAVMDAFVAHPTVVLASCSTGEDDKSIAKLIADEWDALVFAPVKAITKTDYNLDSDGKLVSVSYDVESRQFAR